MSAKGRKRTYAKSPAKHSSHCLSLQVPHIFDACPSADRFSIKRCRPACAKRQAGGSRIVEALVTGRSLDFSLDDLPRFIHQEPKRDRTSLTRTQRRSRVRRLVTRVSQYHWHGFH